MNKIRVHANYFWNPRPVTGTSFIDPGTRWQNAFVERFNGKAPDELFAREIYDSIREARSSTRTGVTPTIFTGRTEPCTSSRLRSSQQS